MSQSVSYAYANVNGQLQVETTTTTVSVESWPMARLQSGLDNINAEETAEVASHNAKMADIAARKQHQQDMIAQAQALGVS